VHTVHYLLKILDNMQALDVGEAPEDEDSEA
jgi:hypothetical protein